jgi:hypothetical protein
LTNDRSRVVVLAVRGQESMPGNLGMVSGLMPGLSIGLGGLALLGALLMRAVPEVPLRARKIDAAARGAA